MNTEKVRNKLAALTEKEKYFERNFKKSEKYVIEYRAKTQVEDA